MTAEEARGKWQIVCETERMKHGVPEAGRAALDLLLGGGVEPRSALGAVRAAVNKQWNERQVLDWKSSLQGLRDMGTRGDDLERAAWEALGEKPPPKAAPKPTAPEKPGARWFGAGQGPLPEGKWQGGDLDRADAYPGPGPGGLVWDAEGAGGAKVERWVVYLCKDASSWWASNLDGFWKGTDDYFRLGVAIVPQPGQKKLAIVDRNPSLEWKAAYVFYETGGKRAQLADGHARWVEGTGAAELKGAVEVPGGYRP